MICIYLSYLCPFPALYLSGISAIHTNPAISFFVRHIMLSAIFRITSVAHRRSDLLSYLHSIAHIRPLRYSSSRKLSENPPGCRSCSQKPAAPARAASAWSLCPCARPLVLSGDIPDRDPPSDHTLLRAGGSDRRRYDALRSVHICHIGNRDPFGIP